MIALGCACTPDDAGGTITGPKGGMGLDAGAGNIVAASDGGSAQLDASPDRMTPAAQMQAAAGESSAAGRVTPEAGVPVDTGAEGGEPLSDASRGSQEPVDATAMVKSMRFGANIGNTLEDGVARRVLIQENAFRD